MKRIKQILFLFVNIFFSCSKEDFISDEISRVDEISKDGSRNGSKVISYDEFLLLADESYQNDSVYLKYLNNKKDFNDQPQLRSSGATIVELTATQAIPVQKLEMEWKIKRLCFRLRNMVCLLSQLILLIIMR
jgi:hypothetical protein